MSITPRLERALSKLYEAFHSDQLNPECCKQCAVGNICNNNDTWKHLTYEHGSKDLTYVGLVNEKFGRKIYGYSPKQLLEIEAVFLRACGYGLPIRPNSERPTNANDKELLFNGLCAVVGYLCVLDGVKNVMDYSRLFEYEGTSAKYEFTI